MAKLTQEQIDLGITQLQADFAEAIQTVPISEAVEKCLGGYLEFINPMQKTSTLIQYRNLNKNLTFSSKLIIKFHIL